MATAASAEQKAAFLATYGPQAQAAGATLGVDPTLIYGQWANESAYGTNSQSAAYNVAGIMPGGTAAQYASPADFESAYVGVIQNNDPLAVNTGSNAAAFVSGLRAGHYYGDQSDAAYDSYLSNVTSLANSSGLVSYGGSGVPVTSQTAGGATTGTVNTFPGTGAGPGLVGSIISPVWELISRGMLIIVGLVLLAIGLIAMLSNAKTVQVAASSLGKAAVA